MRSEKSPPIGSQLTKNTLVLVRPRIRNRGAVSDSGILDAFFSIDDHRQLTHQSSLTRADGLTAPDEEQPFGGRGSLAVTGQKQPHSEVAKSRRSTARSPCWMLSPQPTLP